MDKIQFKSALTQLNIPIDEANLNRFEQFERLLLDWNERMNLTAITDPFEIMTKHYLDSVLPLSVFEIPHGATLIDVGTGAGFPGMPLKLTRADISVMLLDSLNKRINFLNAVIKELFYRGDYQSPAGEHCSPLQFGEIRAVHGRAEELGRTPEFRENFDVATSRAVAALDVLAEFCLPFVKIGGVFLALKSLESGEEIESAKPTIATLGGEIENEFTVKIPYTEIERKIVVIRKIEKTSEKFPRNMKKIKRGG